MNFEEIYATNAWTGKETRSGPGSSIAATKRLSKWLISIVDELLIGSFLDIPCGEGKWMPDIPGYIGADIVPAAVEAAKIVHPDRDYVVLDGRTAKLPKVEAIFSRDCMQHLPVKEGKQMLNNFVRSGAKWLIASHYVGGANTGPRSSWHAYDVNLSDSPFSLGDPLHSTDDGYDETGTRKNTTKTMSIWEIN